MWDEQLETYLNLDLYPQLDPPTQVPLQALPMLRPDLQKQQAYGPSAKLACQNSPTFAAQTEMLVRAWTRAVFRDVGLFSTHTHKHTHTHTLI